MQVVNIANISLYYRSEWRSQQKIMRVRCLELQFVATFELIIKTIMVNEELVLERTMN